MADTVQKKTEGQFRNKNTKSTIKEGETIIDKAPSNNQKSTNSVGEYVDFEEID